MRPIKFRGNQIDNGKRVYGYYCKASEKHLIVQDDAQLVNPCGGLAFDPSPNYYINRWFEVIPETVGQFTGLFDKNGKEIYEGDILRYPPKDEWDKTNYAAFEVFFHDGDCASVHIGFQMNRMHFHGAISGWGLTQGFVPSHVKKMEIIGDVHSNPKLLAG